MASQPRAGLSVPPEGLCLSLPPLGVPHGHSRGALSPRSLRFPSHPTSRCISPCDLHGRKAFSLRLRSALQCWTLGRSSPRLAWLVPWIGKASVSNILVSPCPPIIRKALDMACLLAVASGFAILPPSPPCGILWHSYSHPTFLGWHPLCPVAPLAHLPPLAPPRLTLRLQPA